MNCELIKEIIDEHGIFEEEEHYDLAEYIIWECVKLVDPVNKQRILEHFGIIHK